MVKVLLVARFNESRQGHAPLYQRALERLGATVTPFNLERTGWLDRLTQRDLTVRLEQAIGHSAPEVILVTDGEVLRRGAVDPLRPATTARWAFWFPWQESPPDAPPPGLVPTDIVFAAGARRASRWARSLDRPVHSLDAGCDPSVHRPLRVRDPFRANVVFAGTATPYRESVLGELVEFGLALWGPGWKKTGLREYCRGELLSMDNYVRAYAGGTIGINLHRDSDAAGAESPVNARLFEIAAIGVPQAVEQRPGLADYLAPGEEVLVHNSVATLRDQVRQTLADQPRRERLARAARQAALSRHTYMHRMRDFLARL